MQQPMNANPVQVVVVAQPGVIDKQGLYKNMKSGLAGQLIGLGIMQLLIGILCIIFQGISLGVYIRGPFDSGVDCIGHGFWTGLLFLITGPFGITGGVQRSRCQVVAFNVLSILSASFAAILIYISVPGAIVYAFGESYCKLYYRTASMNYRCSNITKEMIKTGIAMEAMMAILGLIEGIIAIWSSAICCTIGACCCDCGGSCCCPSAPNQNQFAMTSQPFPDQQHIFIANEQQSASNQQPQVFIPNQSQTFLTNSQHPITNSNQRQQMVQYDRLRDSQEAKA